MEEKLLEIMNKECYNLYMGFKNRKRVAKEMTAHIFEFIEWKDFGDHPFVPWYDEINGEIENYYTDEANNKHWLINDLYEHWLTEVKK